MGVDRVDLAALPEALKERLPFFAYGTLQTGFRNHANVVRGRFSAVRPARMHGVRCVHYSGGWPGLYDCPDETGSVVVGQLLRVEEEHYLELLGELDALEGAWRGRWRNWRRHALPATEA
jgi:gamma-glutamylcyclotransferase (GGCT)/AIG2-like uncharacterized protein YtfP